MGASGSKRKADDVEGDDSAVKKAKTAAGASPTKSANAKAAAAADADGDADADDAKGKGKGKGKKAAAAKKGAPFSWDDFVAHAHALDVSFGADSTAVRKAAVKKFSTGSYGWSYQGNEVLTGAAGAAPVAVRVNLIVTIVGSKPNDKDAAKEDDADADADADAAADAKTADGTSAQFKELVKAACPFADFSAFNGAAKALTVKFGAAGAPATTASVAPFSVDAKTKSFATGSFGWAYHANKKVTAHADAAHGVANVNARIQLNITVANSKGEAKAKGKAKTAKAKAK